MGSYAVGNNHRTFYGENPDNSAITVLPRGYGNDVLKYIEERKMLTNSNISNKTRQEKNKNAVKKISSPAFVEVKESTQDSTTSLNNLTMQTEKHIPSVSEYVATNDDAFLGYRLQNDEYILW